MIIVAEELVQRTNKEFADKYPHFKDFQNEEMYLPYWKLCLQALHDRDLLGHIVFCNDLFCIPPMKTFLCNYVAELQAITGKDDAELNDHVKKSIGAFWGYVFKVALEYADQKSVSVSLNKMFKIKTATYYAKPQKTIVLAY